MNFIYRFKNRMIQWQYARISNSLADTSPDRIMQQGEKNLIKAFHHAARHVPFYKKLLKKKGVDPRKITCADKFEQAVPIINKEMVFPENKISEICAGGAIDDVCLVYSSAGSSSVFSYGVETWKNRADAALGLEFLLDNAFNIFKKKTFLINCLPMGVKIFTRTLPIAETSVREDVVCALILKLKDEFDQFILVGESPFLKKVVEEGIKKNIPWQDIHINCITGGEYIPETYRSYMEQLLGIDPADPDSGVIAVNMGLSELSLSIFSESFETIKIRQAAVRDQKLRHALVGSDTEFTPSVMQYFPQQTWLETILDEHDTPELVVSMLNTHLKIPLIRYNTRDRVKLISYGDMKKILDMHGCKELIPGSKLPFGIIFGKKLSVANSRGKEITVNEVKEALFENFTVAENITGNFKLFIENNDPKLLIQLKPGTDSSSGLTGLFSEALLKYTPADIRIELLPYLSFPYGIEHNFEKKNQYV